MQKFKSLRSNKICSVDEQENHPPSTAKNASQLKSTNPQNEGHKQTIEPAPIVASVPPPSKQPTTEDLPAMVCKTKWYYLRNKWVLDTKDEFYYYWLSMVSCAFTYNLIVVIGKHFLSLLSSFSFLLHVIDEVWIQRSVELTRH